MAEVAVEQQRLCRGAEDLAWIYEPCWHMSCPLSAAMLQFWQIMLCGPHQICAVAYMYRSSPVHKAFWQSDRFKQSSCRCVLGCKLANHASWCHTSFSTACQSYRPVNNARRAITCYKSQLQELHAHQTLKPEAYTKDHDSSSHLRKLVLDAAVHHELGPLAGLADLAQAQQVAQPHARPVRGGHSRGAPVEALGLLHNILLLPSIARAHERNWDGVAGQLGDQIVHAESLGFVHEPVDSDLVRFPLQLGDGTVIPDVVLRIHTQTQSQLAEACR